MVRAKDPVLRVEQAHLPELVVLGVAGAIEVLGLVGAEEAIEPAEEALAARGGELGAQGAEARDGVVGERLELGERGP